MVQDKLTASKCQPLLQRGYQCTLCCPIFPTPWLLKTQIQHSSQQGYSFKEYYCKPEVLGEQELKAQEASAPGLSVQPKQPRGCHGRALLHHSCTMNCFRSSQLLLACCFCLHNTSAIL